MSLRKNFCSEKTVKVLVRQKTDQKERILLVHEKDETATGGKPAGWGLPGGGIKSHEGDIFLQVKKLLPVEVRIPFDNGEDRLMTPEEYKTYLEMITQFSCVSEAKVMLTAIKEGMEETGFLLKPVRELFREPTPNSPEDHEVILLDCKIITGRLSKHSLETDDCGWFEVDVLPKGIYKSDAGRIAKGMAIIHQPPEPEELEEETKEVTQ